MLPAKVRRGLVRRERIGDGAEALALGDAVDVDHPLPHVHRVARDGDDALDDDRLWLVDIVGTARVRDAQLRRRLVDDDAPAFWRGEAGDLEIRERDVRTVRDLIDEEEIGDEERWLPALGRDVIRRDEEDADEELNEDTDEEDELEGEEE